MPVNYAVEAAELAREIAEVEAEIANTEGAPPVHLQARRASLKRSHGWYAARIPGRRIQSIGTVVADEIQSAEAV